jgi:hypothetical protein
VAIADAIVEVAAEPLSDQLGSSASNEEAAAPSNIIVDTVEVDVDTIDAPTDAPKSPAASETTEALEESTEASNGTSAAEETSTASEAQSREASRADDAASNCMVFPAQGEEILLATEIAMDCQAMPVAQANADESVARQVCAEFNAELGAAETGILAPLPEIPSTSDIECLAGSVTKTVSSDSITTSVASTESGTESGTPCITSEDIIDAAFTGSAEAEEDEGVEQAAPSIDVIGMAAKPGQFNVTLGDNLTENPRSEATFVFAAPPRAKVHTEDASQSAAWVAVAA